jgi:ferrous iron transport protein B
MRPEITLRMDKTIKVALIGTPNSGKTTIFNELTGARQHVGNYPGVTVEHKSGELLKDGYRIKFTDLPGIYSLFAYSPEEAVSRNYLLKEKPDVVLNIIDSSALERNLYLSTQLIEMNLPIIFVFNMFDSLKNKTDYDLELLSKLLGGPIAGTIGNQGKGIKELPGIIMDFYNEISDRKKTRINYHDEIENEIKKISDIFVKEKPESDENDNLRWVSVKLLEQDPVFIKDMIRKTDELFYRKLEIQVSSSINHINSILKSEPLRLIAEARYGFINGALKEAFILKKESNENITDKLDGILLNKFLGLPIFAFLMWAMFQVVFKLGDYPMNWLNLLFLKLSEWLTNILPSGLLQSLLVDGVISGVGGILIFTPKIMLLFIFIAFFEDSGYMARVAFIMDRIMHKIGLHGKSFIPMLIGFGCTIPAYMCARTLENKNDRMITMHINTFMSCGGRLPIYILFAGTFFPGNAGNIIFSIYLIGIVFAIATAKFLRVTRFRGEAEPFVMELPPYRMPSLKSIFIHMWERTWQYLKKAGTIILAISMIMWFLFTFPLTPENEPSSLEDSYAGRIGVFISPIFKPLGFDWKLSLASLTGTAGKEVVVSTIGTLFSLSDNAAEEREDNNVNLSEQEKVMSSISDAYHPLTGYNFMLFSLLYFPCIASLAVFQKEAGFKELMFQVVFTMALAWVVSFIVYQIGRFFI